MVRRRRAAASHSRAVCEKKNRNFELLVPKGAQTVSLSRAVCVLMDASLYRMGSVSLYRMCSVYVFCIECVLYIEADLPSERIGEARALPRCVLRDGYSMHAERRRIHGYMHACREDEDTTLCVY